MNVSSKDSGCFCAGSAYCSLRWLRCVFSSLAEGGKILFASFIFFIRFIHRDIFYELIWNPEDQSPWCVTNCLRQIIKFQGVPIMILAKIELICLFVSIANRSGAACCKFLSMKPSVIPLCFLLKLLDSTRMQILIYILNYMYLNPSTWVSRTSSKWNNLWFIHALINFNHNYFLILSSLTIRINFASNEDTTAQLEWDYGNYYSCKEICFISS